MSEDLEVKLADVDESIEHICDQLSYYSDLEVDIMEDWTEGARGTTGTTGSKVDQYLLKRVRDAIRNLQKDLKSHQKMQHEIMLRLNL
jgi:hypothetical protein